VCQVPDFGPNKNLSHCHDSRIFWRQTFEASDHLYGSKYLLRNSTDMGASLVTRTTSDGLDKLCFLHNGELLSADHTRRGQRKGSKYQWFGHPLNIFLVFASYSRATEFTVP